MKYGEVDEAKRRVRQAVLVDASMAGVSVDLNLYAQQATKFSERAAAAKVTKAALDAAVERGQLKVKADLRRLLDTYGWDDSGATKQDVVKALCELAGDGDDDG